MDVCKAENIYYSTGAYSSVVAAWNADQKDTSTYFITILIALLYFKSEGCWFESREEQIFKIRSTQIWNIPTPLLCQGSAQWPHLGKKCWTQKRRLGFVPLSLISLCCPGTRVGHCVLFRSERIVLLRSFKARNVLLRSFFEFLATYETQKNNAFFCVLFLRM